MEKKVQAIGGMRVAEGAVVAEPPEDSVQLYHELMETLSKYNMSSDLSEEDLKILCGYLPALGADEYQDADDGTLQGNGAFEKEIEGAGITVKSSASLDCTSLWGAEHMRKQWTGIVDVTKVAGDARVLEIGFNFGFYSFGYGPAPDYKLQLLYHGNYSRVYDDPNTIARFEAGEPVGGSRIDISKHVQQGFFMFAKAIIRTTEGTLII